MSWTGPGLTVPSTVGQRLLELSAGNLAFFFTKELCCMVAVRGRREYVANYFNCFASA